MAGPRRAELARGQAGSRGGSCRGRPRGELREGCEEPDGVAAGTGLLPPRRGALRLCALAAAAGQGERHIHQFRGRCHHGHPVRDRRHRDGAGGPEIGSHRRAALASHATCARGCVGVSCGNAHRVDWTIGGSPLADSVWGARLAGSVLVDADRDAQGAGGCRRDRAGEFNGRRRWIRGPLRAGTGEAAYRKLYRRAVDPGRMPGCGGGDRDCARATTNQNNEGLTLVSPPPAISKSDQRFPAAAGLPAVALNAAGRSRFASPKAFRTPSTSKSAAYTGLPGCWRQDSSSVPASTPSNPISSSSLITVSLAFLSSPATGSAILPGAPWGRPYSSRCSA